MYTHQRIVMLKYLLQYKHNSESEQFSCLAFKENEVSKNTNDHIYEEF